MASVTIDINEFASNIKAFDEIIVSMDNAGFLCRILNDDNRLCRILNDEDEVVSLEQNSQLELEDVAVISIDDRDSRNNNDGTQEQAKDKGSNEVARSNMNSNCILDLSKPKIEVDITHKWKFILALDYFVKLRVMF